jgi:adenosylhomocysteine nucleosidase
MKRIVIFAALYWECAPILRRLPNPTRTRVGEHAAWQARVGGCEVWLIKTGVGLERAEHAARAVVTTGAFDLFLSTGCAGALVPQLRSGDLAVASTVIWTQRDTRFETDAHHRLRAKTEAQRAGLSVTVAPVLCTSAAIATAAEKRQAAETTGAVAVEMEGAAIAARAADTGARFCSVRTILDTVDVDLDPSIDFVDRVSGNLRPGKVARYVARHPTRVPYLVSLRQAQVTAQQGMSRFFEHWL